MQLSCRLFNFHRYNLSGLKTRAIIQSNSSQKISSLRSISRLPFPSRMQESTIPSTDNSEILVGLVRISRHSCVHYLSDSMFAKVISRRDRWRNRATEWVVIKHRCYRTCWYWYGQYGYEWLICPDDSDYVNAYVRAYYVSKKKRNEKIFLSVYNISCKFNSRTLTSLEFILEQLWLHFCFVTLITDKYKIE